MPTSRRYSIKNTAYIEATLLTISHYSTVEGPVLTLRKTEAMWIGKYRESKEMSSETNAS